MVFIKVICPGCQRNTIYDGDDVKGYCMHCGSILDASIENSMELDDDTSSTISMIVEMGMDSQRLPDSFSDRPWYPQLESVVESIDEGEIADAVVKLEPLLESISAEEATELRPAIRNQLAVWLATEVMDGAVYNGGLPMILRLLEDPDNDYMSSRLMLASLAVAMMNLGEIARDEEDILSITSTTLTVLCEYMQVEPDIRMQLELCTEYMSGTSDLLDLMDDIAEDEDVAETLRGHVYAQQDFIHIVGDMIYDMCRELGEDRLDEIADAWEGKDIAEISTPVLGAFELYLDGNEKGVREVVQTYLDAYKAV